MTPRQALNFIRDYGVVLEAAKGLEPSLAECVAESPIQGSWWGHPRGHEIFELTRKIRDSKAVLICTLADGRMTYIHRRLWPPFIRMAEKFPPHALDKVCDVHLPSGRHQRQDIPFPQWIPKDMAPSDQPLQPNGWSGKFVGSPIPVSHRACNINFQPNISNMIQTGRFTSSRNHDEYACTKTA